MFDCQNSWSANLNLNVSKIDWAHFICELLLDCSHSCLSITFLSGLFYKNSHWIINLWRNYYSDPCYGYLKIKHLDSSGHHIFIQSKTRLPQLYFSLYVLLKLNKRKPFWKYVICIYVNILPNYCQHLGNSIFYISYLIVIQKLFNMLMLAQTFAFFLPTGGHY